MRDTRISAFGALAANMRKGLPPLNLNLTPHKPSFSQTLTLPKTWLLRLKITFGVLLHLTESSFWAKVMIKQQEWKI